jgi:hypothetical protein
MNGPRSRFQPNYSLQHCLIHRGSIFLGCSRWQLLILLVQYEYRHPKDMGNKEIVCKVMY